MDAITASPTVRELSIRSSGEELSASHHSAAGDETFERALGRPCVVMAHGFGNTRDSGLEPFAAAFAAAGTDALLFDYRGFGRSGGEPRQVVSPAAQLDDYRAAIAHARGLPGVDPARIVLWGVSYSGGHVFQLAAEEPEIAAMIALTPAPDGRASFLAAVRREGPRILVGGTLAALRDVAAARRGEPRVTVPVAARPGETAALSAPGALAGCTSIAGPSWRNEVAASILLTAGSYRPIVKASEVRCPALVQVADFDTTAPAGAAMKAAERARAEVRHLPCDHFDVYPGRRWFETACRQQVDFLARHLA